MSQYFETIKVENGRLFNIEEHNHRLNKTISQLYNKDSNIDLSKIISLPHDKELFRCKVIYDKQIKDIQFYPYTPRYIKSFKLITSNIKYNYKYVDRDGIDKLFLQKGSCDEILIVDEDGLLKDTSISNIAIKKEGIWLTPKNPLLYGTMRSRLIKKNILYEKDLFIKDIENIDSFVIINAMIGLHEIIKPKFSW